MKNTKDGKFLRYLHNNEPKKIEYKFHRYALKELVLYEVLKAYF